ncbi:MAG: class I SAM-dependent DNA methyltransferase [Bacteroidales bacterium]|nr:class I SAM-dependent DNA methyltransferase [Bacteroidales bacterium]
MAKKIQLGYREIEERLRVFHDGRVPASEVGYRLLFSFGKSERDIMRYKEGKSIMKTFSDGLLIKGLFCFQSTTSQQLSNTLEQLKADPQVLKAAPKIVAVSDGEVLLAYDLREHDTYENRLDRLSCDFAFFYPIMGVERVHNVEESPADVKAAEKLAKLHDELRAYNDFRGDDDLHDLNIFITRLLFCFFAEDTGIFEENLFTSSIIRYTKEDGSDLSDYLDHTFNVMDLSVRRMETPSIVKQFPYVNGGLFSKHIQIPRMGQKARRLIIECGELDWKDINPDIFGSMIQAVVNPEERANQGMHYTSVPNIMKVINPLFLDDLREEYNKLNGFYEQHKQMLQIGVLGQKLFYEDLKSVKKKGNALLKRMSQMKFFDPACGSGNFLIITYKSLRFLEMDILRLMQKCTPQGELLFVDNSVITLNQFYGIELLDFPHEVAMLSLWLAEHQMNTKLNENFGVNTKALPLKNITQIVCGNACRLDWNAVCPHTPEEEVFVFGNPPYLGASLQDEKQKRDMENVFRDIKGWPNLDYIACWFYLGSTYIKGTKAMCAFVSTKSICQGEQVALLWDVLINKQICLNFAYSGFRWNNNAKNKAHVFCVIIGIANESETEQAKLYTETEIKTGKRITPYLQLSDNNIIIKKERKSISNLPSMDYGSKPADGGNLILDAYEKDELITKDRRTERFIYNYVGAEDYINGKKRYCLWISDNMKNEALCIPSIKERVLKVYKMRMNSKKKATQEDANFPYRFAECRFEDTECIIIPRHTATDRKYIPFGYLPENSVVADSSFAIYNAPVWLFGVVTSLMHMIWTKTVGGYLGTSIRYSNTLCYNTFPFPTISPQKKAEIEEAAENVLVTREFYPDKTLADLYDPDKMPQDLREAHERLDDIVESCYPGYPFANDEARLECLFKLYEKMSNSKT